MRIVSTTRDDAIITISFDDLAFLHQGMREMLEALDDKQLRIRTGQTSERAEALMKEIKKVCEAINNHE
jgi:hypothetical protein